MVHGELLLPPSLDVEEVTPVYVPGAVSGFPAARMGFSGVLLLLLNAPSAILYGAIIPDEQNVL